MSWSDKDRATIDHAMGIPPAPDPEPIQRIVMTKEQFEMVVRDARDQGRRDRVSLLGMLVVIAVPLAIGFILGLWF